MAVFEGSVDSQVLRMLTGVTVILPENRSEEEPPAVLYLLHGLADNHSCWLHRTSIELYARKYNLAIVMPEVQRSMYTDMAFGLDYFTYITEELPAFCKRMFRIADNPARTYIAGLSMGGYGALKCALHHPEQYAAVGAFSAVYDVKTHMTGNNEFPQKEWVSVYGERVNPENDLFMLTANAAKNHLTLPSLYLTCGLSDGLYPECERFRKQLSFLKIQHLYEEWAGGHTWDVWDRSIRQFLQLILK